MTALLEISSSAAANCNSTCHKGRQYGLHPLHGLRQGFAPTTTSASFAAPPVRDILRRPGTVVDRKILRTPRHNRAHSGVGDCVLRERLVDGDAQHPGEIPWRWQSCWQRRWPSRPPQPVQPGRNSSAASPGTAAVGTGDVGRPSALSSLHWLGHAGTPRSIRPPQTWACIFSRRLNGEWSSHCLAANTLLSVQLLLLDAGLLMTLYLGWRLARHGAKSAGGPSCCCCRGHDGRP